MKNINDAFVFMKVGNHAGESFETILKRKNNEYKKTGMIFWGYGGVACHPINQVQTFARLYTNKSKNIYLIMNSISSNDTQSVLPAKEFSKDGVSWEPIPKGINVTGSKYAIVLDEIRPIEMTIDLNDYEVAVGPSRGKTASLYLKGRTDKACLIKKDSLDTETSDKIKKVDFAAKIIDPFAVLLR